MKDLIEHHCYPGYYLSNIAKNVWLHEKDDTHVLYITDREVRRVKTRIYKCGYMYFSIVDNRKVDRYRYHRVKAFLFLDFEDISKIDLYVINHKDLDKLNNDIDNLEIVTQKQNIEHAREHGLVNNTHNGILVDLENKELTYFSNIYRELEERGFPLRYVKRHIKHPEYPLLFKWGLIIKNVVDLSLTEEDIGKVDPRINLPCILENTLGEEFHYSVVDMGEKYNLSPVTISLHLRTKGFHSSKNGVVRYINSYDEWVRAFKSDNFRIGYNKSKEVNCSPILVTDTLTNNTVDYPSIKNFLSSVGYSYGYYKQTGKCNGIKKFKHWIISKRKE